MTPTQLQSYIHDVPDFPKKGIIFKDISPLLASAKARTATIQAIKDHYSDTPIDVVAGIEARGFLFGILLAEALEKPFLMIRKPNKLPGAVVEQSYDLEYGQDTLEVQKGKIAPGSRVLLHDDVLATGGTAQAAAHLIESVGSEVAGLSFLLELEFLKGAEKLTDYKLHSLIHY